MVNKRRLIFLVVATFTLITIVILSIVHFRGRSQLARIKQKLLEHGEKLKIEELTPAGSANQDSFAQICAMADALAPGPTRPDGIVPMDSVGPGRVRVAWALEEIAFTDPASGRKGWITNTWNDVDAQIAQAAPALDHLQTLLKSSIPLAGYDYQMEGPVSAFNFRAMRRIAHYLALAALDDLHNGNLKEAVDRCESLCDLAQIHSNEPSGMNAHFRNSLSYLVSGLIWNTLQAPGLQRAHLDRLQIALSRLFVLNSLPPAIRMIRAQGLYFFSMSRVHGVYQTQIFRSGFSATNDPASVFADQCIFNPIRKISWADQDEIAFLNGIDVTLESATVALSARSWNTTRPLIEIPHRRMTQVYQSRRPDKILSHMLTMELLPDLTGTLRNFMRVETVRQMAMAAVALKRFQLTRGHVPQKLSELCPEFLSSVPVDYMDGKPLRYKTIGSGDFVLYSVGFDGTDEYGSGEWAAKRTRPGDFPPWFEANDMVWPRPALEASVRSR